MVCNKCGVDKPATEYYSDSKRKSGISTICKDCTKNAVKKRSEIRRDEIREYHKKYYPAYKDKKRKQDEEYIEKIRSLKTPCAKCGEERLYVIDFHHIDPSQKSFNIYRKTRKSNFSEIEKEASKCVCLCRNCHSEFHYLYGQRPKFPIDALFEYLGKEVNKNV